MDPLKHTIVLFLTLHYSHIHGMSAKYELFLDPRRSIAEAKTVCKDNSMVLVKIGDEDEFQQVKTFLSGKSGIVDAIWIGLHYTDKFRWISDDSEATYTNWAQNEPNNLPSQGGSEANVAIKRDNSYKYETFGSSRPLHVLCEEAETETSTYSPVKTTLTTTTSHTTPTEQSTSTVPSTTWNVVSNAMTVHETSKVSSTRSTIVTGESTVATGSSAALNTSTLNMTVVEELLASAVDEVSDDAADITTIAVGAGLGGLAGLMVLAAAWKYCIKKTAAVGTKTLNEEKEE